MKKQKTVSYTYEQLIEAYDAWVNAKLPRDTEWCKYCDIRDGSPPGTNERRMRGDNKNIPVMDKETYMRIMGYAQ